MLMIVSCIAVFTAAFALRLSICFHSHSCSATLNKWLKQHVSDAVIHSFRHSFRDRLRNAGVQSEMIDQLGGWSRQSVGQGYGKGYNLKTLSTALKQVLIDDNVI